MPSDPYIIVRYSPLWPGEFHRIGVTIRKALGTSALRIDHIGSTAVPGLCSKNVIDVQVTVPDVQARPILQAMVGAAFELRSKVTHDHIPPGYADTPSDWEKRFYREIPGTRQAHIHLRSAGKPNQRYALLFRDYLRAHAAAATAYGQIKERLAPRLERLDYINAKDPVCDLIIQAAERWAGTSWAPPPSDA